MTKTVGQYSNVKASPGVCVQHMWQGGRQFQGSQQRAGKVGAGTSRNCLNITSKLPAELFSSVHPCMEGGTVSWDGMFPRYGNQVCWQSKAQPLSP